MPYFVLERPIPVVFSDFVARSSATQSCGMVLNPEYIEKAVGLGSKV